MMNGNGDMLLANAQLGDHCPTTCEATISLAGVHRSALFQPYSFKRNTEKTGETFLDSKFPIFSARRVKIHHSQANIACMPQAMLLPLIPSENQLGVLQKNLRWLIAPTPV
jgi:hypothetical protein